MKRDTFTTVARLVDEDPLTEAQIRQITGADRDDIVDAVRAAEMLGVTVAHMRKLKGLPRVRVNTRRIMYRLIDVRRFRDENCW